MPETRAQPNLLRMTALAYWAFGVGSAILGGSQPSAFLDLFPQRALRYPIQGVGQVVLVMTAEIFALYALLRWLPASRAWRVLAALTTSIALLAFHLSQTG